MCLCSDIQHGFTQPSDNQKVVERLRVFLPQLYTYISSNEQLIPHLPFILQKRTTPVSSTISESLTVEKRIAKIFEYDPADNHVLTFLDRNFDNWNRKPQLFFACKQAQPTYDTIDYQSAIILTCLRLEQFDTHSRILRIIYCVALSRCRRTKRQSSDTKSIAHKIFPIYYPSKPLDETSNDMQSLVRTIEAFLRAGPRYENIAEKLGVGSLFLLGDIVPLNVWERRLPMKGPIFERAMTHMIDKSIVRLGEKYGELVEKLIRSLENFLPKMPFLFRNQTLKRKPSHQLDGGKKKKNKNNTTRDILNNSGGDTEAEPIALDHTTEFAGQDGANSPRNSVRASYANSVTSIRNPSSIYTLLNSDSTTSIDNQQLPSQTENARQIQVTRTSDRYTLDRSTEATNE
ncbi:hypothetical protein SS1G_02304 [Sclerotinia sclerotiorum 1980 UF-70]|uniref:Uncharacterized protein n=2 Tax=Sclerotinia sclerotiorum (strain ATCC 18683 / 1980 / Ss-1) TaxID=665079 RepID=A7EAH2_SCLS1|nr:hypothetical protein SS1G_02304 [Sclerotinia sclerotiorum 1980 UF-70]APA08589.1 hypothetical protein sscle_04g033590 [Sclerotinia sclerotiorum 1980 UF-70]EDN99450.1 hypothetical protein SS1G_02304 [Sclerotinia sclerotiorum 1980 UF-70]